jgi:hypothetical protein
MGRPDRREWESGEQTRREQGKGREAGEALIKNCGSGVFNRSRTGNASKSRSFSPICALRAAEVHLAPGADAAAQSVRR